MSDTNISNEAVQKATNKGWKEWFAILDSEDSTKKSHKEIAAWLSDNFEISGWWAQMVTVQYERERGMREVYEKKDGFEASKSKTINVSIDKLYQAWTDESQRSVWLDHPDFTIRKANKNKSIRISWHDDTNVVAGFYKKSNSKSQLSIQHSKLYDQDDVQKRKEYWEKQIKQLIDFLSL